MSDGLLLAICVLVSWGIVFAAIYVVVMANDPKTPW